MANAAKRLHSPLWKPFLTLPNQPTRSLSALRRLPAFAPVASKLIVVLSRDAVNFKDVAALIQTDAGVSAGLLRLANSAIVGRRYRSTNILDALSLLGVSRVAGLTVTLCMGKLVGPMSKLPLMRQCWRHNLATGLVAEQQARDSDIEPEKAYMFGLLAGLGQLALLALEPATYSRLVDRAVSETIPLEVLETEIFGFDSRQAGSWLVSEWQLPKELLDLYALPSCSPLASLIREADEEATRLGFGLTEHIEFDPLDTASFEVADRVNQIEQELGL